MPDFSFQRGERLKSRKVIEQLFKGGQSFAQYPLRIVWIEMTPTQRAFPAQFALSVSKKKFKRAVHRNRIRRLVREAYRLHKHRLYQRLGELKVSTDDPVLGAGSSQLALMVIYTATEILPFAEIEKAMQSILERLGKKYRAQRPTAN